MKSQTRPESPAGCYYILCKQAPNTPYYIIASFRRQSHLSACTQTTWPLYSSGVLPWRSANITRHPVLDMVSWWPFEEALTLLICIMNEDQQSCQGFRVHLIWTMDWTVYCGLLYAWYPVLDMVSWRPLICIMNGESNLYIANQHNEWGPAKLLLGHLLLMFTSHWHSIQYYMRKSPLLVSRSRHMMQVQCITT